MDSKTYALAMAALDSIRANQQQKNDIEKFTMQVNENERIYQRNKKDSDVIRGDANEKQNQNTLFSSLNQRVGQVTGDWTPAMITELNNDINTAQTAIPKDKEYTEEYGIMYNALKDNLSNQKEIIDRTNFANAEYNKFEDKLLDVYNLNNPEEMSDGLKTILELEKNIITNYKDDMSAHNKSLFRNTSKKQLPRVKAMIKAFSEIDSTLGDNKFTPDITNFTSATTQIEQNGQLITIQKSPSQLRTEMIQAYSFLKAGNLQDAQRFYNKAIIGYRPRKSSKEAGTTSTGMPNTQYQGVNVNGVMVVTDVAKGTGYEPYGRLDNQVYDQKDKVPFTRQQMQEFWEPKLAEWKKNGISQDPYLVLTEGITNTYFNDRNPVFNNVEEFRQAYIADSKLNNNQGGPITKNINSMIQSTGFMPNQGKNALSNVLFLLEDPANKSTIHYNISQFQNTFIDKMQTVNSTFNQKHKDLGLRNEEEMFQLWESSKNSEGLGKSFASTDMAEIYQDVYLNGGTKQLSSGYKKYQAKTTVLPEDFMTDRMDKSVEFIGKAVKAYMGTEGMAVTDADLTLLTADFKGPDAKKARDIKVYNWLNKLSANKGMWEDVIDDIGNSSGDYEKETLANIRAFKLVIDDFHINFNKKYYNSDYMVNDVVKNRVRNLLIDGLSVGDGYELTINDERGLKGGASKYFNKPEGNLPYDTSSSNELLITEENSRGLEFAPNTTVIAPGVIQTPYGTRSGISLLHYTTQIEGAKIIGIQPSYRDENWYNHAYGYFDVKAQSYKNINGEDFPLYRTGGK